jgi:hypothetical protein
MGYSLPISDVSVNALLDYAVNKRIKTEVIDKEPEPVVTRLRSLGLAPGPRAIYTSIPDFVDQYEYDFATELVGRWDEVLKPFDGLPPDAPVAVALRNSRVVTVTRMEDHGSRIELYTTRIDRPEDGDRLPAHYPAAAHVSRLIRSKNRLIVSMREDQGHGWHLILGTADGKLVGGRAGSELWGVVEGQDCSSDHWDRRALGH